MTFEDYLRENGILTYSIKGTSMLPLLRQKKDLVIIKPVSGRLKKYDVPLYRRHCDKDGDYKYILHRVVGVTPSGYVIRGDNCYFDETDITDNDIIGVMTEIIRGGKTKPVTDFGYRLYCHLHVALYPLRHILKRMRRLAGRVKRRLIHKH